MIALLQQGKKANNFYLLQVSKEAEYVGIENTRWQTFD